tara:strand:+ start:2272 stop:3090 length:819 start_codon:yes stop_codon:yes gene_type:complete
LKIIEIREIREKEKLSEINSVMNEIKNFLKLEEIEINNIKLIKDGESSVTYAGRLKEKKVVIKKFKENNLKLKFNRFFNNQLLAEITKKKLFPKIIYSDIKHKILIYEFFEVNSMKKNRLNFIKLVAQKIKDLHSIENKYEIINFSDQFCRYKEILNSDSNNHVLEKAKKLFNKLNTEENVFSHNDLIPSNIIYRESEIIFIDYEYSSMNNKLSDLARFIHTHNLNVDEIKFFLRSYGLNKTYKEIKEKLFEWILFNSYLDMIWTLVFTKKI